MKYFLTVLSIAWWVSIASFSSFGQTPTALDTGAWIPVCEGRKLGVLQNQASLVHGVPLHLFMRQRGLDVRVLFTPEHGLKGTAGAGEAVHNATDSATGIPIISLYGKKKKPTSQDLKDIDLLVVDLQDVGARFYTYISTLQLVLEACGEAGVEVCIFDRPNPNGGCIDGPTLDTSVRSFVGMHPIPILHGLTIGELARMMQGEGWVQKKVSLQVIPMRSYRHEQAYFLPVAPSPNLPSDLSIAWYPTLCLFEGTVVSMGRGTEYPFEVLLLPDSPVYRPVFEAWESLSGTVPYNTIPSSRPGAPDPPYKGILCRGIRFTQMPTCGVHLEVMIETVRIWPNHRALFNSFFTKLAGTSKLRTSLEQGMTANEIRSQWLTSLKQFEAMKRPYLLYP